MDSGGSSSSSSSSSSSAAVATTGTGTTSDASSGANTAVTAAAATGAALATNDVDSARRRRRLQGLSPCPFPSSPLPLSHEQIAADGRMVTIYLHQSMVNCLAWGLYSGNMMQFDLVVSARGESRGELLSPCFVCVRTRLCSTEQDLGGVGAHVRARRALGLQPARRAPGRRPPLTASPGMPIVSCPLARRTAPSPSCT